MSDFRHVELARSCQALLAQPHQRLRVLFWHWGRGGAGSKFTFELVRAAQEVGHMDCYVSAVAGCELAGLVQSLGEPMPLCAINTFKGDKATLTGKLSALYGLTGLSEIGQRFKEFVARHQIDLVVCTMPAIWDVAVLPVIRAMQLPFILVVHDAMPHPGDSYPFRQLSLRREIATADGLVVLSDHVKQQVRTHHGIDEDMIWTLPHGAFEFGVKQFRQLDHKRPARLLFLGRIVAYKGLDLLLDAYRLLQQQGVDITLEVMGSGDISPYAERLDGLSGVTVINQWVNEDDIGAALSRNDVMMLPYREASQSGVAASAAAAGMPMIATPVGGLTEQVIDGTTGVIAPTTCAEGLATAIRRLIDDHALYARCSAGAMAYAERELGWGPIAQRMGAIARDVMTRKLIADYE